MSTILLALVLINVACLLAIGSLILISINRFAKVAQKAVDDCLALAPRVARLNAALDRAKRD